MIKMVLSSVLAIFLPFGAVAAEFVDVDLALAPNTRFAVYEAQDLSTKIATAKASDPVHLDLCLGEDGIWCLVTVGEISGFIAGKDVTLKDGRTLKDAYSAMWAELRKKQIDQIYDTITNLKYVDIVAFGDSLTAGAGGQGTNFPDVMAKELSLQVENCGIGSQTSTSIAARVGAVPIVLKTSAGPRSFLEERITEHSAAPLTSKGQQSLQGFVNGLAAKLSRSPDGGYGLTIQSPVGLEKCAPCEFIPTDALLAKKSGVVIWAGRNNYDAQSVVLSDIDAMVKALGHERYLIVGILNGEGEPRGSSGYGQIEALNASLGKQYGEHFINVKPALMASARPDDAKWIGVDVVPKRLRSDSLHLNADGYIIVGKTLAAAWRTLPRPPTVVKQWIPQEATPNGGAVNKDIQG